MGSTGISRRRFVLGSAAAALGVGKVRAQGWPSRPIRFIVGFPPGGLTDLYARAYGDFISQQVGQPLVIENRPGAGSIIACEAVAKAPADGYSFLFTISTAINQNRVLYKKLPYDPDKGFTFISPSAPASCRSQCTRTFRRATRANSSSTRAATGPCSAPIRREAIVTWLRSR